jgi:hypothetical protein
MNPEIKSAPEAIARYVLSTTDTSRTDRLWPAHFAVFGTNPLSIAYGACGPALLLHQVFGEVPAEVRGWMLTQPVDVESYPPGLYLGSAGVACTLFELGMEERAEEVMCTTYRSPLLYAEPSFVLGAAGWGFASLFLHQRTGRQLYLDRAVDAGEHLLQTAETEGDACCWRHSLDERVHYGFGYGASGIALFLLHLALRTGRDDFLAAAKRGLEYDLDKRSETSTGWQWRRFEEDNLVEPYWLHGSAGVGTAVIRFYRHLGDRRYLEMAEKIAEGAGVKFTLVSSQWEGMSGIGEFLLDMYRATGNSAYRSHARDLAETILWYGIEKRGGLAFPGRWLNRICTDYATGSAGIGLFLHRLVNPCPWWFADLEPAVPAAMETEEVEVEADELAEALV